MNLSEYCYRYQGGSLTAEDPTYVEREADRILYQSLLEKDFCYILTSRQMGKSSLRVRTQRALEKKDIICLSVDLSAIGKVSLEQWYLGITYRLLKNVKSLYNLDWKNWWDDRKFLAPCQQLGELIDEILLNLVDRDIVIFFDEIDTVLGLDFQVDDFFALIRYCYNKRADDPRYKRLAFCLLGVASPIDLISDSRCTPFNIGTSINLQGFQIQEAKRSLLYGLRNEVNNPEQVLGQIVAWTGGQPFLTQKVCHLVARNLQYEEGLENDIEVVKNIIRNFVIQDWESKDNPPHFRTIVTQLCSNKRRAINLLERYKTILHSQGSEARHDNCDMELLLSGLVQKENGRLKVQNRIYQEIFNLKWVENKLEECWESLRESGQADNINFRLPKVKEISKIGIACICILLVSFVSLWSAYDWFTSPPWQEAFNENSRGAIIELVRTLLLTIAGFYFLGIVWRKEAAELFQSDRVLAKRWRLTFLWVGIVVFVLSLYYHLWLGPSTLQQKYPIDSDIFNGYMIPYLVYLPYTLITYNILSLVWVAVSSYAAFNDLNKSSLRTKKLSEKLDSLAQIDRSSKSDSSQSFERIIEREFTKFSTNFITLISRYTILFFSIFIITIFEVNIGKEVLSEKAQHFMVLTYILSILGLFIVLQVFYHYHIAFRKACISLFNLNCNYSDFEARHSFPKLIIKILNSHFNLYLFLIAFLVLGLLSLMTTVQL